MLISDDEADKEKTECESDSNNDVFDVNFPLTTEMFFVSAKTDSRCAKSYS